MSFACLAISAGSGCPQKSWSHGRRSCSAQSRSSSAPPAKLLRVAQSWLTPPLPDITKASRSCCSHGCSSNWGQSRAAAKRGGSAGTPTLQPHRAGEFSLLSSVHFKSRTDAIAASLQATLSPFTQNISHAMRHAPGSSRTAAFMGAFAPWEV